MNTITIPKKEYTELLENKLRYDYLRQIIKEDIFASPPTRDTEEIVSAFNASGLYNKNFLDSLSKGLKRSSYFKV